MHELALFLRPNDERHNKAEEDGSGGAEYSMRTPAAGVRRAQRYEEGGGTINGSDGGVIAAGWECSAFAEGAV